MTEDPELQALVDLTGSVDELAQKLQELSSGMKHVGKTCESYKSNLWRIRELLTLPIHVFGRGQDFGQVWAEALFEVLGRPFALRTDKGEDLSRRVLEAMGRIRASRPAGMLIDPSHAMLLGTNYLTVFEEASKVNPTGLLSFRESSLVAAWTAIETLAGDLWEAAINDHPWRLSELAGKPATRIAKLAKAKAERVSPSESSDAEGVRVGISGIGKLTRGKFNLRNHMGTLLRDRFKFTTLASIRRAYSLAFADRSDGIDAALASQSLDAIAEVRHLLVHRSGKCDSDYVRSVAHLSSAPKIQIGERLNLTGTVLHRLVVPAVTVAADLLREVDKWLQGSPVRKRTRRKQ